MDEIKGIARVKFHPGKVEECKRLSEMATASVTGEVLGTPNAKMKELLGKGGPKLYTPWMVMQD